LICRNLNTRVPILNQFIKEMEIMSYIAPVDETKFWLYEIFEVNKLFSVSDFKELNEEDLSLILREAAKITSESIYPLNQVSDCNPARLENGKCRTTPGFTEAYELLVKGGWTGISGNKKYGGMGLPTVVTSCFNEYFGSACLSFSLLLLMNQGQIDAIENHANDNLKNIFLPKLNSGEWTGTMNLTEPQAGSDVGALTTKAKKNSDGSYAITGQKIYISWGEHDLSSNICHLVLARLPEAPKGSKGVSLFLVPKYVQNNEGEWVVDNDVKAISLEKKMGMHGSPTAVIEYKDSQGWLVGEPNAGLHAMFTMMNNARLGVGIEGLSQCELATQKALQFAKTRKQGLAKIENGKGVILDHPDVRRMLIMMKSLTAAVRALCLDAALSLDLSKSDDTEIANIELERASFLIPIAKAFSTDIGCRVADIGIQVHGGMGYIEETGVAQVLRDVRVTAIYEGTNGIQAIDLIGRKLADKGKAANYLLSEIGCTIKACEANREKKIREIGSLLSRSLTTFKSSLDWMLSQEDFNERLSGATPFLRAFGFILGANYLVKAAQKTGSSDRKSLAHFYCLNVLPEMEACAAISMGGKSALYNFSDSFFGFSQ
jgi:acyl-CoA dehydrogenase